LAGHNGGEALRETVTGHLLLVIGSSRRATLGCSSRGRVLATKGTNNTSAISSLAVPPFLAVAGFGEQPTEFSAVLIVLSLFALVGVLSYLVLQNIAEILVGFRRLTIFQLLYIATLLCITLSIWHFFFVRLAARSD
jgi:hypothetical protein